MRRLRIILYVFFVFLCVKGHSQTKELETSFFVRGKKVENVKYYLIKEDKAYLQKYKDQKIILNDELPNEFSLLAVYRNHKAVIPIVRFNEVQYIQVYYDNRLFNNIIRKKYGRPFFKYWFKKDYVIDLGLDDVYTTFKLKKKYELID